MECIDVRHLGPENTEFHWIEPADVLGLDGEPEFKFPIAIDVKVRRVDGRVVVSGTVECRVRLACSWCLEPFEDTIRAEVAIEYLEGPPPRFKEDMVRDDDADASYYTAPTIDMRDDLRQILLVAAPAYPVCGKDCRGLCAVCGVNRNTTQCGCRVGDRARPFEALGQMLKKEQGGYG